jgi:small neutral amino acid transporter SnatA (MarC family)
MSSQEAVSQFVTLFVVIDPAATIAVFLAAVRGLTRTRARLVAVIAAGIAFVVRTPSGSSRSAWLSLS